MTPSEEAVATIPHKEIEGEHRTLRDCIAEVKRLNATNQQLLRKVHELLQRQER